MIKALAIAGIRFYRGCVSPFLPAACRFHPTCSAYALECFQRHGAPKALRLTLARLLRCHPFHKGGFDPVPER